MRSVDTVDSQCGQSRRMERPRPTGRTVTLLRRHVNLDMEHFHAVDFTEKKSKKAFNINYSYNYLGFNKVLFFKIKPTEKIG